MSLEWIVLNSVNGLGPVRIKKLLERYETPRAILDESPEHLANIGGIPRNVVAKLKDRSLFGAAEKQLEAARRSGAHVLTLSDPQYPPVLREIFAPPPVLFVKGNLQVFARHALAVVGTRRPTPYGRNATSTLIRELSGTNMVIVSGLAVGIDALAHQACLDGGGQTIAVLGCGIDSIYPSTNAGLAERIVENGALISEFPIGTRPEAFNFPRRNRIISGLSAGVLVAEAGQKSGALITANYALQQGRDVFAVPGSIFSEKSVGTFNLIRNGAVPVRTAADIIEALQTVTHQCAKVASQTSVTSFPPDLLSEREKQILNTLSDTPQRLDQLIESADATVSELFDVLLNLELKGVIKQISGQQFVKV